MIYLPKALNFFVFFLCSLIALFTLQQNFDYFVNEYPGQVFILILTLIILITILVLIYRSHIDHTKLLIVFIVLSFIIRTCFAYGINTPVESDFLAMYDSAQKAAAGDFSWINNGYFRRWAYQVPFTLFETLLLKISPTILFIKTINIIAMVFSNILIYCIISHISSKKAGLAGFFIYMVYPQPLLLASVLTNQHCATTLFLLSVYLLIKGPHWKWGIFSGIAVVMGNLFRPDTAVILLSAFAAGFVGLLRGLIRKNKKDFFIFRNAGIFLIVFFSLSSGISKAADLTGLCDGGFTNNHPQWKVITGLNTETNGQYTEADVYILSISDNDEAWKETFKVVGQYLSEVKLNDFFKEKTEIMWAHKETYIWSFGHFEMEHQIVGETTVQDLLDDFTDYDKAVYILLWFLLFISMTYQALNCLRAHYKINYAELLISLIVLVNYSAYIVIEIQTRYRYFVMPFIVILAARAFDDICSLKKTPSLSAYIKN